MSERKHYDNEFKKDAVRLLVSSGRTVRDVAKELGVERSNLGRWRQEAMGKLDRSVAVKSSPDMKPSELEQENRTLRKELNYVREQRDILKKAVSIFSQDSSNRTNS